MWCVGFFRMYSLVQFVDDNIIYITPSKGITPIEGKLVWAPYKCMGYYEANLIATNSNKSALNKLMQQKKQELANRGNENNNVTEVIVKTKEVQTNIAKQRFEKNTGVYKNTEKKRTTQQLQPILTKDIIENNTRKQKDDSVEMYEAVRGNSVQEPSCGEGSLSTDNSKTKSVSEVLCSATVSHANRDNENNNVTEVTLKTKDVQTNIAKQRFEKNTGVYKNTGKKRTTQQLQPILTKDIIENNTRKQKDDSVEIHEAVRGNSVQEPSCGEGSLSTDNSNTKSVSEVLCSVAVSHANRDNENNNVTEVTVKTKEIQTNIAKQRFEKNTGVYKNTEKKRTTQELQPILTKDIIENNTRKQKDDSVEMYEAVRGNSVQEPSCGEGSLSTDNSKTKSVSKVLRSAAVSHVDESSNECEKKRSSHKRHCCFFCKKMVFQIVRHWNSVHSQEDEVKTIMGLHISNPLKKKKIDHLRRKGDYEFNKSCPSNGKDCIVTRISRDQETVFVPCPSCMGYFSKKNLRHHKQKCSPNKGSRHLQGNSRKLTYHIHEKASETLKNLITPDMFHDEVTNQVFFDEILVTYGNYLCIKYTEYHLKNHIRAQLRLLGRFMIRVKVHDNNIKSCKELIHSRNIDTVRKAIDDIAEIDLSSGIYKHPTNARTLLTELKKIIQVVKSESDRIEDDVLMKKAKGFSRRIKQELAPYINRVCKNSENKHKRSNQQKYNELPENEEIGKYLEHLYGNISSTQRKLQMKFSLLIWTELTQNLMVYLAVFNRKRPGESQRIEIADFHNRECVSSRDLTHLDKSDKIQADKYERIGFRGKLGNSTALLIDKVKILPGINLILKYREAAGVHPSNRFLFGKPSKIEKNVTFDAYKCHKQFCENMGINHKNLTFTKLRKHFATEVAKKVTSQEEERRVSTYMSHDFNIHKKIYDQSAALTDITKVSKHLEGTMKGRKSEAKKIKVRSKRKNSISGTSNSEDDDNEKKLQRNIHFKRQGAQIRNKRTLKKRRLDCEPTTSREDYDSDYNPTYDSTSKDDEPSLEEVENCLGKFRTRRLWSSLEKQTTRSFFEQEIFNNKEIGKDKVQRFKEKYKEVMMHRPVSMIRQWVEKEKLKTEQRKFGFQDKRPRYSTPERELLEMSMEHHSLDGSDPSLQELEELITKYDIFKSRTAESLFRKFREMQQRK